MSPSGGYDDSRVGDPMETENGIYPEYDLTEEEENQEIANFYQEQEKNYQEPIPKYLTIKDIGGKSFCKSPAVKRIIWLKNAIGVDASEMPTQREYKFEGRTYISIEVNNHLEKKALIEKLLAIKSIGPCKVNIVKDIRKNITKGTVRDDGYFFKNLHEKFPGDILKSKGILDIKRLGKENSRIFLLTFDGLNIPEDIKFPEFGRLFRVKEYIPNPLKCYKCQKYGHPGKECRQTTEVCQKCSQVGHMYRRYQDNEVISECNNEELCYHCKGKHMAGSKVCETHKKWMKINEMMVLQKISREEARSRVFSQNSQNSYNNVFTNDAEKNKKNNENITQKLEEFIKNTDKKMQEIINTKSKTPENIIEEKVREAIEKATKKMEEEAMKIKSTYDIKFKSLEEKIEEQKKTVTELQQKNCHLEQKNNQLMKDLQEKEQEISKLREKLESEKKESSPKRKSRTGSIIFRDSSEKSDSITKTLIPPTQLQSNPNNRTSIPTTQSQNSSKQRHESKEKYNTKANNSRNKN